LKQVDQVLSSSRLWPCIFGHQRPDEAGVSILLGQATPKAVESGIEFPAHIARLHQVIFLVVPLYPCGVVDRLLR